MQIGMDDMTTFEGCLKYTLVVAQRWGILEIPDHQQVMLSGLKMREGHVLDVGAVAVAPRLDAEQANFLVADCEFDETTVVHAAEACISLFNQALNQQQP